MQKRVQSKLPTYLLVGFTCLLTWTFNYFLVHKNLLNINNLSIPFEIRYPKRISKLSDSSLSVQEGLFPNTSKKLDQLQACKLPKVDPFETTTYSAFLKTVMDINRVDCSLNHQPVFRSSINSSELYYDEDAFQQLNLTDCSYRIFIRSDKTEHKVLVSEKRFKIDKPLTQIPSSHEFITIQCKYKHDPLQPPYTDMHMFVPLNNVPLIKDKGPKRPNVVILLLDSVSRMSFIRTMPETYALLKEFSAIDLSGLMKVGDNTLPNVLAMLTGKSWAETESVTGCVPTNSTPYDNCSFIWKDFKKHGYITSLAEDAEVISTFSFYGRRGFAQQPTDSYFRPLFYAMTLANLTSDDDQCAGSKHRIALLLEYMQKVAQASLTKNTPYFQFVLSSTTHSTNAHAINQDEYIKSFLTWYRSNHFLENSVFILMSDHGARWGLVQETPQGYIESRMPFAYFLFPSWFKEKYPLALENLMTNRNRLTTPFDLHETLKDILSPDEPLKDTRVKERTMHLNKVPLSRMPRGISLFLPISLKRTCSMAGISGLYCVCNLDESLELNVTSNTVLSAAKEAVRFINRKLSSVMDLCSEMKLDKVKSAKLRKGEGEGDNLQTVDLTIVTRPGDAVYEATLVGGSNTTTYNTTQSSEVMSEWNVVDGLTRTNEYKETSWCLNSKATKMYCICKNSKPD